jgi:hypothetical protein
LELRSVAYVSASLAIPYFSHEPLYATIMVSEQPKEIPTEPALNPAGGEESAQPSKKGAKKAEAKAKRMQKKPAKLLSAKQQPQRPPPPPLKISRKTTMVPHRAGKSRRRLHIRGRLERTMSYSCPLPAQLLGQRHSRAIEPERRIHSIHSTWRAEMMSLKA